MPSRRYAGLAAAYQPRSRKGLTLNIRQEIPPQLQSQRFEATRRSCAGNSTRGYHGVPTLNTKVERDERGGVARVIRLVEEDVIFGQEFSASNNWATVQGDIIPRYKKPGARRRENASRWRCTWSSTRTTLNGVLYLDDFELIEQ